MSYVPSNYSCSRFSTYTWCPAEYRQRYIDKIEREPDVAMDFGLSVHKGLELHFLGADGDRAFRKDWQEKTEALRAAGLFVLPSLTQTGLQLIERVAALDIQGMPERAFRVSSEILGAPLIGYVDLWDEDSHTLYDFKVTRGKWSQERADRETWQPCLYSWAYWLQHDRIPRFEYVVMDRVTGSVQQFSTQRTEAQIEAALDDAARIARAIKAGEFDCRCKKHLESAA